LSTEPTPNGNGHSGQVSLRISKNTARWLLLGGVIFAILFSLGAAYYTLTTTTDRVDANAQDIQRFKRAFQADKVCSLSNQGKACIDLFERLARNVTEDQQKRAACTVLEELNIPEADVWRRKANCS
jgi:hypothetical protein